MNVPSAVQNGYDKAMEKEAALNTAAAAQGAEGMNGTGGERIAIAVETAAPAIPASAVDLMSPVIGGLQQAGEDGFRQKYEVLQGKYNNEVPRMAKEMAEMRVALASLQSERDTLNQQNESLQGQAERSGVDDLLSREPEDLDPEDQLALHRLTVTELRDLRKEVASLRTAQGEHTTRVDKSAKETFQMFESKVVEKVPTMQAINREPEFGEWCKVPDPELLQSHGISRTPNETFAELSATISMANMSSHVDRTAAVYARYLQRKGTAERALLTQVSPRDGSDDNVVLPGDQQGMIWGPASIRRLYHDELQGAYRGKDAEFQALVADSDRAQSENRWDDTK
jgi:hypothetical protein